MRDFLIKIFSDGSSSVEITLFSIWHILYILIILGVTFALAFLLKNKADETKKRVLNVFAILLAVTYLGDFFAQPFYDGNMIIDKLPFHICTVLCPFVLFAQFNKKFEKVREPIVVLSIVSALMYITYPGSALGGVSPWCYRVIQTFTYHGILLTWGVLSLAYKSVELKFKNIWKALVGLCIIAVWATIGNVSYSSESHHYDWFFITGSTFPFIPSFLMPFVVITAIFAMTALIYSIYYLVLKIINSKKTIKNNTNAGILAKEETPIMTEKNNNDNGSQIDDEYTKNNNI